MSFNQPKISIIIPSLNQGAFIEQTILSLINQTYKNVEILLIDGGSSDNTLDIIKKYKQYFSFWLSERDSGQSEAINKGLKMASGEIITWLNSDDYYKPNTLEIIANIFITEPNLDLVHGKSRLFGENVKSQIVGLNKDLLKEEYLAYMRFPQPSSFIKTRYFNAQNPLNTELHYAMDFELITRAILQGAKIKRIDDLLSHYRLHSASKSNGHFEFLNEWTTVTYKVLNSIEHGKKFADQLDAMGLVLNKSAGVFDCSVHFNQTETETIFLEHLHLIYDYHYREFQTKTCWLISSYLKENHRAFYHKNNYRKYNFRLRFVPKFIFNLARRLRN